MRNDKDIKNINGIPVKRLPTITKKELKKSKEHKPIARKQGVSKYGLRR